MTRRRRGKRRRKLAVVRIAVQSARVGVILTRGAVFVLRM